MVPDGELDGAHALQLHVDLMRGALCRPSDVFGHRSKHQAGRQLKGKDASFRETLHLFPHSDACCTFCAVLLGQLTKLTALQTCIFHAPRGAELRALIMLGRL